jgi:hypothetical protein
VKVAKKMLFKGNQVGVDRLANVQIGINSNEKSILENSLKGKIIIFLVDTENDKRNFELHCYPQVFVNVLCS